MTVICFTHRLVRFRYSDVLDFLIIRNVIFHLWSCEYTSNLFVWMTEWLGPGASSFPPLQMIFNLAWPKKTSNPLKKNKWNKTPPYQFPGNKIETKNKYMVSYNLTKKCRGWPLLIYCIVQSHSGVPLVKSGIVDTIVNLSVLQNWNFTEIMLGSLA